MNDSAPHAAFAALFRDHAGAVLGLLRRLCRNRHDADDVFQETAVRAWQHICGGQPLQNPRSWLMTVAYRTFLDLRSRSQSGREAPGEMIDPGRGPESAAEQLEEAIRLRRAVDELSAPGRDVLLLHYSGGLSLRETAETLQVSEGTVKSRLSAALVQLRKALR